MKNVNFLGFLKDSGKAENNVSGTRCFLANHLAATGCLAQIHDVLLNPLQEKFYLIKNFSTRKKLWGFKFVTDLQRKDEMSRKASRLADISIRNAKNRKINATLQVGSEFSIFKSHAARDLPQFSYHDNNIMAYLKSNHGLKISKSLESRIKSVIDYESEIYHNMTGIFTMTEFLKDSFVNDFGISRDKVHCIGFGANTSSLNYINKDYSKDILLFVAKDSFEEKGGWLVVEAFREFKQKNKDAELYLVGQDIKVDCDGVTVIGYLDKRNKDDLDHLIGLYRKATLFVMPSYVEATGNVFLEAMSFQLPCIGANVSAMPEIIEGNKCGLVVASGSVEALTKSMAIISGDKKMQKQLGDNGYNAVVNGYSWNGVVEKALGIMERYV